MRWLLFSHKEQCYKDLANTCFPSLRTIMSLHTLWCSGFSFRCSRVRHRRINRIFILRLQCYVMGKKMRWLPYRREILDLTLNGNPRQFYPFQDLIQDLKKKNKPKQQTEKPTTISQVKKSAHYALPFKQGCTTWFCLFFFFFEFNKENSLKGMGTRSVSMKVAQDILMITRRGRCFTKGL